MAKEKINKLKKELPIPLLRFDCPQLHGKYNHSKFYTIRWNMTLSQYYPFIFSSTHVTINAIPYMKYIMIIAHIHTPLLATEL